MTSPIEFACDDVLTWLQAMPDASADALLCDPPYGLSDHGPADVLDCLRSWIEGREYRPARAKRGFMGRSWDAWVPGPEVWREALRVLRPGGHLLAFAGTRTMDLLGMAIRLGGFELRDAIGNTYDDGGRAPLLAWTYGQGMPKGGNLKPAWEPILLARKPLDGTIARTVREHGTGALNIAECRIQFQGEADEAEAKAKNRHAAFGSGERENHGIYGKDSRPRTDYDAPGRWPANVVHDGSDAAVAAFARSGISKSTGGRIGKKDASPVNLAPVGRYRKGDPGYGDTGAADRFFYCAKASRRERDMGLDESFAERPLHWSSGDANPGSFQAAGTKKSARNPHPCVKPLALTEYLARLLLPPVLGRARRILIPFAGSGSEAIGALRAGWDDIRACERDAAYVAIATARAAAAMPDPEAAEGEAPAVQADLFAAD